MIVGDSKKHFAHYLYQFMRDNENIWLITADLGFRLFDDIQYEYPNRFVNTGSSEQAAVDIGVGLAMSGKIPIVYSITPFILFRPAESLRIYLNNEQIPVKLVGSGRDKDYHTEGFTHFAEDAKHFIDVFPNIKQFWPAKEHMEENLKYMLFNDKPSFMSLRKGD